MSADRSRPASNNKTTSTYRRTSRESHNLHPLRNHSLSDDFFTDSIMSNGSKIPTPSPTKPENVNPTVQPRRAIGNAKSLRAAWDATAGKDRQPTRQNDPVTVRHIKPQPAQTRASKQTSDLPQRTRNSTPSPARRTSVTSPESTFSSPPKGLTEAYQRIADEEDLAGAEGQFSDEETGEILAYDEDRARVTNIRKSKSPVSIRRQRRESPQPNMNGAHMPEENKENLIQDDTEMSRASDLSFLNQLTDQDLAAKLTPHAMDKARDKARLQRAIQRDSPITFSRAKMYSADEVPLHEDSEDQDLTRSSNGSTESGRSDRLDMAVNIPKGWGSKAKQSKEWLNRIHRNNRATASDSSLASWTAAAAEVPLPPNGDHHSNQTASSKDLTPVAVNHKSSLDKLRQWELNDFTGTSLQVSNSPPVRPRNPALDQIREREIENLERRAVATSRLEELRKQESLESLRRSATSPQNGEKANVDEPKSTKSVKLEGYGEPIPNSPIIVYKQGANAISRSVSDSLGERPSRSHQKKDSMDDLQRLARAISESPRPGSSEDASIALKDFFWKKDDTLLKPTEGQIEATPLPSRLSALDLATKTPVVSGAWTDTILPDTIKNTTNKSGSQYLKTPQVPVGGWSDTPMPTSKNDIKRTDLPSDLTNGIVKSREAEPNNEQALVPTPRQIKLLPGPRSALAALVSRARERKTTTEPTTEPQPQLLASDSEKTADLGELTLESLEDMLTVDDMTSILRMSGALDVQRSLVQNPQTSSSSGDPEELILDRLSNKLERLQSNIHSTRRGISKLERSVSNPESASGPCEFCGCPRTQLTTITAPPNSTTISLTLPFQLPSYLRLFHGYRPTALGWIVLLFWTYYILESLSCMRYCHPLYADFYDWPTEPEPKYGVVIPTLFYRNFGPRTLVRFFGGTKSNAGGVGALKVVLRLLGRMTGFWDGFVSEGADVGMGTGIGMGAGDAEGSTSSMEADEYL